MSESEDGGRPRAARALPPVHPTVPGVDPRALTPSPASPPSFRPLPPHVPSDLGLPARGPSAYEEAFRFRTLLREAPRSPEVRERLLAGSRPSVAARLPGRGPTAPPTSGGPAGPSPSARHAGLPSAPPSATGVDDEGLPSLRPESRHRSLRASALPNEGSDEPRPSP